MPYAAIPGTTQLSPFGQYPYRYAYTYMGLGRHSGSYPVRVTRGRRAQRLGDVISDLSGIISGGATGSVAGPVGTIVGAGAGLISTLASLFGGGASGATLERQQHIFALYYQAMTQPGSPASVAAVRMLNCIAGQDESTTGQAIVGNTQGCDNPQQTRTFAQTALTRLASQGWSGVNSYSPVYTGSLPVSQPTGALTPQSMLPAGVSSGGFSFGPLALLAAGLLAFAVIK
jgi:hypothetical protein